jgi:hypothetical protein
MTFLRDSLVGLLALALTIVLLAPIALVLREIWGSSIPIGLQLVLELVVLTFGSIALLPLSIYAEARSDAGRPIGKSVVDLFRAARWPWPVLLASILGPVSGVVGWTFRGHSNVWMGGVGLAAVFIGFLSPVLAFSLWRHTRASSRVTTKHVD